MGVRKVAGARGRASFAGESGRNVLHTPVAGESPVRRRRAFAVLLLAAGAFAAIVIAGLLVRDAAVTTDFSSRNLAPSLAHPFGTDWMGRDMLCRTLAGLSTSIVVGAVSALCSSVVALALAAASTFLGRRVDAAVEWLTDLVLGIPHLVLLILVSYALGRGALGVFAGVALTHWPSLSRVLRAEMLKLNAQPFMACSRSLGVSRRSLAATHMLPHVLPQYLVGLVLLFPHAVLHEASITFLGFGLSPEEPAIGVILSEAMGYLTSGAWWLAVFPGAALLAVVLAFDRAARVLQEGLSPARARQARSGAPCRPARPLLRTVFGFRMSGAGSSWCSRGASSGDAGGHGGHGDMHAGGGGGHGDMHAGGAGGEVPLLQVDRLSMSFLSCDPHAPYLRAQTVETPVIRDLSLSMHSGELLAVVGASGSGKTLLADAIMGLFETNAQVSGDIRFKGERLDAEGLARLRGHGISIVPQSVEHLDPLMRVGKQVVGACGRGATGRARRRARTARMRELFRAYGLDPRVERMFPHELSGGMVRRVLLACALIDEPQLLVADEPTPGLDMDLAAHALDDLRRYADAGGAVLLITHDLELALRVADRIAVFRDGSVVEETTVASFENPELLRHPFSRALWHAMPEHDFAAPAVRDGSGRSERP